MRNKGTHSGEILSSCFALQNKEILGNLTVLYENLTHVNIVNFVSKPGYIIILDTLCQHLSLSIQTQCNSGKSHAHYLRLSNNAKFPPKIAAELQQSCKVWAAGVITLFHWMFSYEAPELLQHLLSHWENLIHAWGNSSDTMN